MKKHWVIVSLACVSLAAISLLGFFAASAGRGSDVPAQSQTTSKYFADHPTAVTGSVKSLLSGGKIEEGREDHILELCCTPPADGVLEDVDPSYTATYRVRGNTELLGLSQFCPTFSYVFPNEEKYDAFVDIFVRKKNAPIGGNYAELSFLTISGPKQLERVALETETVETYQDAAEFYQKIYGVAADGREGSGYRNFTCMENVEISGVMARHYSYEKSLPQNADERLEEYDLPIVYEKYGEHYLFETESYIYVLAFSGSEKNEELLRVFHDLADHVKIDRVGEAEPPVWAQEIAQRTSKPFLDRTVLKGSIPDSLKPYLKN